MQPGVAPAVGHASFTLLYVTLRFGEELYLSNLFNLLELSQSKNKNRQDNQRTNDRSLGCTYLESRAAVEGQKKGGGEEERSRSAEIHGWAT